MTDPAPIGISVYSRLSHLRETIEALRRNELADQSELYIFSDAPQPGDEQKVQEVREYIRTIEGFRRLHLVEQEENDRIRTSRGGLQYLLEQFGRAVFLEEDVVTAPHFLRFINDGLEFYRDDPSIVAVCGYSPPIAMPQDYRFDTYLSPRFSAWGFGMWRDRFEKMNRYVEDYEEFASDRKLIREFCKGGTDLLHMLRSEVTGRIDALDVKVFYHQFRLGMYSVHPTVSLTRNIGFDGTGLHCGESDRFEVDLYEGDGEIRFSGDTVPDERIVKALWRFRSGSAMQRLARKARRGYRRLRRVYRRVV